jgi:hypothetical protein
LVPVLVDARGDAIRVSGLNRVLEKPVYLSKEAGF